jgi:preprotein translocase subunit SecD
MEDSNMDLLLRTLAILSLATAACSAVAGPALKFEIRRAEVKPGAGLIEATVAGGGSKVYLHAKADIVAADIAEARATPEAKPAVEVVFTEAGRKKIAQLTKEHVGKPIAIMIDGKIIAAPTVRSTIETDAMITGSFTRDEADRIARGINGK